MPQESFAISIVNPDELLQDVHDIKHAVGKPTPPAGPIADSVSAVNAKADTITTGVQAANSQLGPITDGVNATNAKLDLVDFTSFATKEDIAELRCLVLHLWWLDHGCRYLFTGHTDHLAGLVYERIGLRDAPQNVTPDVFKGAAKAQEVEERLLPCDIGVLLGAFNSYAAYLASQQAPSQPRRK